jgi:predicted AAA+ superfamily ATPase
MHGSGSRTTDDRNCKVRADQILYKKEDEEALEVSGQTISRHLDLLVDLLLVRRLQPYWVNVGKRLIKSPRIYIRDSGLTHALLNIPDRDTLLGHPVCGGSWEGFFIENIVSAAPQRCGVYYYRTSGGAGIDLVLEIPGGELWAIEIKRSRITNPGRGFHQACLDIQPRRKFLVHSGKDHHPLGNGVDAIGLRELCALLQQLHLR